MNIKEWLVRQINWSRMTFGPGPRTGGITKHIEKEVDEIRQAPDDLEEWIDVAILALDGAWRCLAAKHAICTDDTIANLVTHMLEEKQSKNHGRTYPMPTSQDEPSEHDRSNDAEQEDNSKVLEYAEATGTSLGTQVGGGHYKDFAIQPVEFCQRNRLPYCEANAIKYACRHRLKGGAEDVKKAIHYLQLLLEIEYPEHDVKTIKDVYGKVVAKVHMRDPRNAIPHSKRTGIG